MKRAIKQVQQLTFELNIEFYPQHELIESASLLNTQSDEYNMFIQSMVDMFAYARYELYNDPEYTHKSNKGSDSWYYTFLKIENEVEIRVVVNVRISDHVAPDRKNKTAAELRDRYVHSIGKDLTDEYKLDQIPLSIPVDIIFDETRLKTYTAAKFYLRDQIQEIEDYYQEWKSNKEK